ncbi:outer membrane protein assembly factor BamD [bacterium]|nr:outer membrane protein assembly factor BamD [bacterium]
MNACRTLFFSLWICLLAGVDPLPAQDTGEAAKKILEAYNAGKYEDCIKLSGDFIKANPQSPNLPSAYLLQARSYYNLSQWMEAIAAYGKVASVAPEKDIKEEAAFFIAQCAASQAADTGSAKSPEKKKGLEDALQKIQAFLQGYPESSSRAEAFLLQSRINLLLGKYSDSSHALDEARKADKDKAFTDEIDYMQAFAEARRADELLADFKKNEADAALARAGQIYAKLASSGSPALATEANLQLASLDLAARRYEEAIARLRTVSGKDELIAKLDAKIAPLRAEVARESNPSPEKLKKIQREQKKIEEVRSRPDFAAQALLQLGNAFLQTRRYDEARLVFRHVARFGGKDLAGPAEQQVILTYALQGRTGEADKRLEEYRRKYPDQKGIAGLVDYLVGRALLEDGKSDEAIKRLESAQDKAAGERFADEIPRFIANAYQKAGKGAEALKYYERFLNEVTAGKRKVPDESYESTLLLYASALITEKKVPEGVAKLKELIGSAKTAAIKEDAELRLGYALRTAQQPAEAAEAFAKFAAAYPESANLGTALLARGDALVEAKKTDQAVAAWKDVISKKKDSSVAVDASERIWRTYLREKKPDQMLAAQEEQLKNFPKEPRNIGVYLARGASFAEARDEAQAIAGYRKAFELFKELFPDTSSSPPPVQISDLAFSALQRSADLEVTRAKALGTYSQLGGDQKKKWQDSLNQATDFYSQAILGYSAAKVPDALAKLVDVTFFRFQSGEAPVEDCLKPFRDLAAKASANPGLVAQILFSQASVPFKANQTGLALRLYEEAYKQATETKVSLGWRDLERFGQALLGAGKHEEARPIFERIQKEFPASGPKDPKQFAQASAVYGLGLIDFKAGRKEESEKQFAQLAKDFPWSEKLQEANFLRGQALAESGKYDGTKEKPGAFDLWTEVIESNKADNETKARAMLAFGKGLEDVAAKKIATKQIEQGVGKPPLDPLDLAVSYYQKVDLYYDSLPEFSAEGLLKGAKIRRSQQKNDEARKMVASLLEKYGLSSSAAEARELLKSLPPASAPAS